MKRTIILLIIFAFPLFSSAQTTETISIGTEVVQYDEMVEDGSSKYYYNDDSIVLSEHEGGVSILYKDDFAILEAHDTDSDGSPDVFIELDNNEIITNLSGEGAVVFERKETKTFEKYIEESGGTLEEDLVGDLSDIKIPGSGGNTFFIVLLLLGMVAGYMYWSKNKKID